MACISPLGMQSASGSAVQPREGDPVVSAAAQLCRDDQAAEHARYGRLRPTRNIAPLFPPLR